MSEFLDLEGLKSYHAKLPALIASIKGESSVTSFNTRTGDVTPQDGDYNAYMVGAVPDTRTVNGKQLNANITLTKDDIEGLEDLAAPDLSGYVPTSRTVNGKSLRSNISLSATDVGASIYLLSQPLSTRSASNLSSYASSTYIPCYYSSTGYKFPISNLSTYIQNLISSAGSSGLVASGTYAGTGTMTEESPLTINIGTNLWNVLFIGVKTSQGTSSAPSRQMGIAFKNASAMQYIASGWNTVGGGAILMDVSGNSLSAYLYGRQSEYLGSAPLNASGNIYEYFAI